MVLFEEGVFAKIGRARPSFWGVDVLAHNI
jgi:hypothetical protein